MILDTIFIRQRKEQNFHKLVKYLRIGFRYGDVKGICWLANQQRALLALQKHYAVTVYHLENTTSNSKSEDRAKARVSERIEDRAFCQDAALHD